MSIKRGGAIGVREKIMDLDPNRGDWKRGTGKLGTIKNAGVENAGLENAGPS